MRENILIHEFQKNAHERVRIQLSEFKGKKTIDIRVYYKTPGRTHWKPSRKGITMERKHAKELLEALEYINFKYLRVDWK